MPASLNKLAKKHGTDKGPKHRYTPIYTKYFSASKDKHITLLEIGVNSGASIKMWLEYFPAAHIVGFDLNNPSHYGSKKNWRFLNSHGRFTFYQGDQSSTESISQVLKHAPFDYVIDDGSHISEHHQICLACLFPGLKPGGIYIIEDLQAKRPLGDHIHTTEMIKTFLATGIIKSRAMSDKQAQYVESNISSCRIYKDRGTEKICFMVKK